jgi:hypothetical protein
MLHTTARTISLLPFLSRLLDLRLDPEAIGHALARNAGAIETALSTICG